METAREFLIENKLDTYIDDPILFELIVRLTDAYANKKSIEIIDKMQTMLHMV